MEMAKNHAYQRVMRKQGRAFGEVLLTTKENQLVTMIAGLRVCGSRKKASSGLALCEGRCGGDRR
jgi:hypothetical protein